MANPFYLDMGFSLDDIATVTKIYGALMSVLGAVAGRVGIGEEVDEVGLIAAKARRVSERRIEVEDYRGQSLGDRSAR